MLKMSEWISVKDKLPELGRDEFSWIPRKRVLVWDGTNRFIALYEKHPKQQPKFIFVAPENLELPFALEIEGVTHWMALPEPPKE
jgi:hypothetical protein